MPKIEYRDEVVEGFQRMTSSVFQSIESVDRKTLKFVMSPTRVTYANTLRRAIQTEVSVLAFRADMSETGTTSDVVVYKNSTPMSNEMLADRIGLLPITPRPSDLEERAGWNREKILFRLQVKNDTDSVRLVTAADFECLEKRETVQEGEEDRIRIPNTAFFPPDPISGETCILAVLKPKQDGQAPEEIHLEAFATFGKGREHTRFNPSCQASYGYTRDEDPTKIQALFIAWLKDQKKVDASELEKQPERKTMLEREFRSLELFRCYKSDPDGEPMSFDFTVETVGPLTVETIVYEALISVSLLCEKYSTLDKGDLPEMVEIRPADARLKGYDVWFKEEDHTLGNLLQTWIDDNRIGREGGINFVGYKVPHPLRSDMVLRIGVEDGDEEKARLVVAEASRGCAEMFRNYANDWFLSTQGKKAAPAPNPVTNAEISLKGIKKPWNAHAESKQKKSSREQ